MIVLILTHELFGRAKKANNKSKLELNSLGHLGNSQSGFLNIYISIPRVFVLPFFPAFYQLHLMESDIHKCCHVWIDCEPNGRQHRNKQGLSF